MRKDYCPVVVFIVLLIAVQFAALVYTTTEDFAYRFCMKNEAVEHDPC